MFKQTKIAADVFAERNRQDEMFGEQNHHPAYWLALLGKQMGQLGEVVVDREWASDGGPGSPFDSANRRMREEAIQLVAVGVAMIEAIDRGQLPRTLASAMPADPRQRAKSLGIGDEQLNYDSPTRPPVAPPFRQGRPVENNKEI